MPTITFDIINAGDIGTATHTAATYAGLSSAPTTVGFGSGGTPGDMWASRSTPSPGFPPSGPGNFECGVLLFRFNTSLIPDNATIKSATLRLTVITGNAIDTPKRTFVLEWANGLGSLGPEDWTITPSTSASIGIQLDKLIYPGVQLPRAVEIQLQNVSNVSKTGFTILRGHISGGQPTGRNEVYVQSFEGGATSTHGAYPMPQLVVTYTEPPIQNLSGSGSGGGKYAALARRVRSNVPWRIYLCDRAGVKLESLTPIASSIELQYHLNKPASLAFVVPADDKRAAGVHAADGHPYFTPNHHTVKAWRQELDASGNPTWVIRFAGFVWQVQDTGDAQNANTRVLCYDPLMRMTHRYTGLERTYIDCDASMIARDLLNYTNTLSDTGLTLSGGTYEVTAKRSVVLDRKQLAAAMVELSASLDGFDVEVVPLDQTDGKIGRLNCWQSLGMPQPDLIYGWGVPPHNVLGVSRLLDGETLANSITGWGAGNIFSQASDTASIVEYAIHESQPQYTDITNRAFLSALVSEELNFRKEPREIVEITPVPGLAPEPFTHFHLGDTIYVNVGARLRGGFSGEQRIYGFTISIDNASGAEVVSSMITSPEA